MKCVELYLEIIGDVGMCWHINARVCEYESDKHQHYYAVVLRTNACYLYIIEIRKSFWSKSDQFLQSLSGYNWPSNFAKFGKFVEKG